MEWQSVEATIDQPISVDCRRPWFLFLFQKVKAAPKGGIFFPNTLSQLTVTVSFTP